MFAVIKSGGRQYKVTVGQTLEVARMRVEDGTQVRIEEVLLISDADNTTTGTPIIENAHVLATAVRQTRGEKLIVFKYKSKKRYRHKRGHRQDLTVLRIDDIVADGRSLVAETAEAEEKETPAEDVMTSPQASSTTETQTGTEASENAPETETQQTSRRRRTRQVENTGATEGTESTTEEEE